MGLFISVEGPDGSGKTLQMDLLENALREKGYDVIRSREPGGTRIGEAVRKILLGSEYEGMDGVTEALLFAASRRQHVCEVIRPALEAGKIVLLDRYVDSSFVYQGVGRGLGFDKVMAINDYAMEGLLPDVTLLIYVDYETGLQRKKVQAGHELDRLEEETENFHRKINEGYYSLVRNDPDRVKLIDGCNAPEKVHQNVMQVILPYLQNR